MNQFYFATSCVNAVSGEDIQEMCDIEQELDAESFIEFMAPEVGISKEVLSSLGYQEWAEISGKSAEDLFINDPTVKCARSYYQGIPCYFVEHSRIEHVFIAKKDESKLLDKEQSMSRRSEIESLVDEWNELGAKAKKGATKKRVAAFERAHGEYLGEYNIPLAAVVAHEDQELVDYALHLDEKAQNPFMTLPGSSVAP